MDFAFYRNFIIVAETGNLSAAAKRLGIVQPALSAQMKAIERNYGVQLFKMQRGKRHIELTEAGETFLQQARQLCNTEDDISLRMFSLPSVCSPLCCATKQASCFLHGVRLKRASCGV